MLTQDTDTPSMESVVRERALWWHDQYNAGRLELLSEAYAEDAVLLVAGIPPICGFAAIRQFVEMIRSSGVRDIMIDIERCEISGDLAYLWGRYIIKVLADGGDRMDYGKILEVWRNLPQGWRMVADAVSPDQVPGA